MEMWKARALSIGWFQRQIQTAQMARDDSADDSVGSRVTPMRDEDKPPPLAADEVEPEARAGELSAEDFAAIEDACDRLDARLTKLEQRRDAERKLEELEDALLEASDVKGGDEGTIRLH
jgi:hypothetical protein